jgi:uncharacterized protein
MPNRLAGETSPYLQQHKDNPVDWYPWGDEALARAKKENKPILLSIGYSACHWCHVMAHESFEDADVAEAMNQLFVNIKVDREERPDLDQIYQLAHQMLTQRPGGWPLTVFLTPDQLPFFAGTYFPKEPRYGMTGFPELIANIAAAYRERQTDIGRQNEALLAAFARIEPKGGGDRPQFSTTPIEDALVAHKGSFDPHHGGFGGAPKFPHPAELQFCLRRHAASGDTEALHLVAHTLEKMAQGGICDQLGGGFCRYSVDDSWTIPHFEKMLYDNGPLLALFADAWTVTRKPLFARVAAETAGWVMREMQSPEGGYYSSLDADSEHVEGKFYVWTPEQAAALLSADEFAVASPCWGLEGAANFEASHWHLRLAEPLAAVARRLGKSEDRCAALLESARSKLLAAREQRIHPGRDEKILTSWNALMIAGMARAGTAFGRPAWIASAGCALEFVRNTLWREGRLLATYKDGRAHLNAYLDDYAFLLAAAIELLQAEFSKATLEFATELAEGLLERFEDRTHGGFFFTSHDHERLIHRSKPGHDNATPSGNGVAAYALQRLAALTGEVRYSQAAERALAFFYPAMADQPGAHASLLVALEEHLTPMRTVILRGPQQELGRWYRALAERYLPATMVVAIPSGAEKLPPVLAKPVTDEVAAWVCEGATCLAPIVALEELCAML